MQEAPAMKAETSDQLALTEALTHTLLAELARRGATDDETFVATVMRRTIANESHSSELTRDLRWACLDLGATLGLVTLGLLIAASLPEGRLWLGAGLLLSAMWHLFAPAIRRYRFGARADPASPRVARLLRSRLILDQTLAIALTIAAVILLRTF